LSSSLKALTKKASNIPFIHDFPSPVGLGIAWDTKGVIMFTFKTAFKVLGPMLTVEAGECHVLLAMSAKLEAGYSVDPQESVRKLQEGRSCGEGVETH
jgi:hypothetical protein